MIYTKDQQLNMLKTKPSYRDIQFAVNKNTVVILSKGELNQLIEEFDYIKNFLSLSYFIPASGAATRLFKDLFTYKNEQLLTLDIKQFYDRFKELPIYPSVLQYTQHHDINIDDLISSYDPMLCEILLDEDRMAFALDPKLIIPVHTYRDGVRTPLDEHVDDIISLNLNNSKIHFTISKEHETKIIKRLIIYKSQVSISYSFQNPLTNTLTLNPDFTPFMTKNGQLVRPGGHGTLLENLNQIKDDVVYIKNVDNVQFEGQKSINQDYLKAMVSYGKKIKDKLDLFIKNDQYGDTAYKWYKETFKSTFEPDQLKVLMKRPLRICGVVKNTGEPGGGPYFVKHNGMIDAQIVELSEIDQIEKENIIKDAQYFNPVNMVLFRNDAYGTPYDLFDFMDHDSYFLTSKSYNGKPYIGLEYPGLWNGSMAYWNTIFVELPLETFTPVKTIFDLLRSSHKKTL
jgi:hypothetical protein